MIKVQHIHTYIRSRGLVAHRATHAARKGKLKTWPGNSLASLSVPPAASSPIAAVWRGRTLHPEIGDVKGYRAALVRSLTSA